MLTSQQIGITNNEASVLLENHLEKMRLHQDSLDIPMRSDCTEYKISDLAEDQQQSLAEVLAALRSYCQEPNVNKQKVLRVTVSGVAGSGKSTWINTLVTVVRKMFNNNDTIAVFAPTGAAAFNAGGQTLHRGFGVPFLINTMEINPQNSTYLLARFANTLIIIIDERSMLDATMLGTIKHYMKQCAHSGQNKNHPWGGIPIIILVGDDYQLPPISPGAFYALNEDQLKKTAFMTDAAYSLRKDGFEEFREIGKKVIYLHGEKRVNEGQDEFKSILQAVRCEDDNKKLTEKEITRLLELDINHTSFTDTQKKTIQDEATFVFANKEPRDALNSCKLKNLNMQGSPVARIRSKTEKNGRQVSNQTHFDSDRTPNRVLLCKGARVTLNGCNPDPKNGLFHGSLGIVRDIVYDAGKSPNLGDFPSYILVEFYQYCGEDIIPEYPRCIPIVPRTSTCNFPKCYCTRTYIPLALAYGKTAHTFQGINVGPVPAGRPENPIQKIVVEPGNRQFEGNNVGLFYQLLARATTIGTAQDKLSSAIYFDGKNFSRHRFENLNMRTKKELYKKAILRHLWVEFLRKHKMPDKTRTTEEIQDLFTWVEQSTITDEQLHKTIQAKWENNPSDPY